MCDKYQNLVWLLIFNSEKIRLLLFIFIFLVSLDE